MQTKLLLKKYNVAAPRYTSYPTVPYWEIDKFNEALWLNQLKNSFITNNGRGVSLYIHLPFCESLCTYCGCNTRITKNHGVETPYINALIAEWKMYCEFLGEIPKISELHLGGGTPTFFVPENLKRLITAILGNKNENIECSFEGHPDNTTTEHLQVLFELGFKRLSLGIQDFDPKVQKMINRFQTPEQVLKITNQARLIGYSSINFDLIYGLPGQTLNGLKQTVNEVIAIKPDRIAFYSYAHVPWIKPGQRHFTEKDIPDGEEKFKLYQTGRDLLIDAGYVEVGMDHFALKSDSLAKASSEYKLHRNFMGYTHQYTKILVGLGVSSISDCKLAFAQNAKTLEGYLSKIENGKFAFEKGHLLTDEDLIIREHILNLMCKNGTTFNDNVPTLIKKRLQPLINDELVKIQENEISIENAGKPFLRNICMALDERLWQSQPNAKIFSNAL